MSLQQIANTDIQTGLSYPISTINSGASNLTLQTANTTAVTVDGSQNVTLNAGTTNGVAYLNGSKVLTTGSALTFDGSNFKLTGSDNNNLVWSVNSNAGAQSIRIQANIAGLYLQGAGTVNPLYITHSSATGYIVFRPASDTEQMRLTSTGLGIGTSSPSTKLHVYSSTASTTNPQDVVTIQGVSSGNTDGTFGTRLQFLTQNPNGNFWKAGIGAVNDQSGSNLASLAFYTAAAGNTLNEVGRFNSAGQLGIGTTSPSQTLDVNGVAKANYYYYQSSTSAYSSPSSTTLTMPYTGEGCLYLISSSNHTGSSNVSQTMWMLSYSGNGSNVVTQIATGGNYTPSISVSGSTVTITNSSGTSRIIYASFIRLL